MEPTMTDGFSQIITESYRTALADQFRRESTLMRFLANPSDPKIIARRKMVRDVYGSQTRLWELRDAIDQMNGVKRDDFGDEIDDD